jgi:hypothetical protein
VWYDFILMIWNERDIGGLESLYDQGDRAVLHAQDSYDMVKRADRVEFIP